MTKKYEKFEEWMVGKEVEETNGDVGVVIGVYEYSDAAVWVDWGNFIGNLWIDVEYLKFIEEAPTKEEDVSIPWEEGQIVWDTRFTRQGVVHSVDTQFVSVKFGTKTELYFLDGKSSSSVAARRVLFFSEPTVIADTVPPKKPFVPKLKEGEKILLKVPYLEEEKVVFVRREEENTLYYIFEDGTKDYSGKSQITVTRIGEEIKWES